MREREREKAVLLVKRPRELGEERGEERLQGGHGEDERHEGERRRDERAASGPSPHRHHRFTISAKCSTPSGRPSPSLTGSRSVRREIICESAWRKLASPAIGSPGALSPARVRPAAVATVSSLRP